MKILLNTKLIDCPTSWQDITLSQFKDLMNLKIEDNDEVNYMLFFLSIVLKIPVFELEKVEIKDLELLYTKFDWVINSKPSEKIPDIVLIDGKKYYFNPQIDKLGFGVFTYLQNKLQDGFWNNSEDILSCLLLPVKSIKRNYSNWKGWRKENYPIKIETEEFNFEVAIENSKKIGQVSINEVFAISQFFFLLLNQFIKDSLSSLAVELSPEKKEELNQLQQEIELKIWRELNNEDKIHNGVGMMPD